MEISIQLLQQQNSWWFREELIEDDEKILDYRQYEKLKNTYVDKLPTLICQKTGRINASFNPTIAATGRLSSNNPNLETIHVRTEMGRRIREGFVPEPGYTISAAD